MGIEIPLTFRLVIRKLVRSTSDEGGLINGIVGADHGSSSLELGKARTLKTDGVSILYLRRWKAGWNPKYCFKNPTQQMVRRS